MQQRKTLLQSFGSSSLPAVICKWFVLTFALLSSVHAFHPPGIARRRIPSSREKPPCPTNREVPPLQVASSSITTATLGGLGRGLGREGLSKYHQSILSRMATDRQRFVSGRYAVVAKVIEPPKLKWLRNKKQSATQLMVNGTAVDLSLASYDRFQWIDDEEREELYDKYTLLSWELMAVIAVNKPGYVSVMPGNGAGSTSASLRFLDETPRWDRWKRMQGTVLDELEEQVCSRDRVWVTGFSITGRHGYLYSIDTNSGHIQSVNKRTAKSLLWPNEVGPVPAHFFDTRTTATMGQHRQGEIVDTCLVSSAAATTATQKPFVEDLKDAVLVSDGFLVPGKERGGIYVVKQPGNPNTEWTVCVTDNQHSADRWFYHRAVWIDLTGDGRKSILTARAKFPLGSSNNNNNNKHSYTTVKNGKAGKTRPKKPTRGELVCLEMPKPFRIDERTGTPLEADGTIFDPLSARHLPWKVHVLDEGPDVMFNVVDLDTNDDTVEVISSQFFGEKVTLHSIQRGATPKVTFQRTIDKQCGKAFGCIVADLNEDAAQTTTNRCVIDGGSTVETLRPGDPFSHLLVTSHECSFREEQERKRNVFTRQHVDKTERVKPTVRTNSATDGGSLFAYRVPENWKTDTWKRSTIATGFKVQGQLNNMINPGAPGFVYTFHARQQDRNGLEKKRPLIAVAGDCAESAYIFRPAEAGAADSDDADTSAVYDLMCELQCGSTVGSIGVGYGDFCETDLDQESGYAKLYIPCYEDDRILVFGLGSGEE
ncbi:expressed unknown protein [Seminavis robusta]|uniref:Uncharacterized protein n=1 Tax=Seminavis robusta TaxID=568900 RepID=A0A9N8DYH1_9STRA|nr:expressed unknown protein [Seminavis robusta]|eukprot:Sro453_g146030.1 n/a (767) ;mRNA; f:12787-15346